MITDKRCMEIAAGIIADYDIFNSKLESCIRTMAILGRDAKGPDDIKLLAKVCAENEGYSHNEVAVMWFRLAALRAYNEASVIYIAEKNKELAKLNAETEKLKAETEKLKAETELLKAEEEKHNAAEAARNKGFRGFLYRLFN